jgi:O-acetylhomoserine (thiol)-lyase
VAQYLSEHPKIAWVHYPGMKSSPQYARCQKYLRNIDGEPAASGLLAFGVKGKAEDGVKFIEGLQFLSHVANIGDTRTLVIHPASTTHRQLTEEQRAAAGVGNDLIRMSVGLEHIDDILWDIEQSLSKV